MIKLRGGHPIWQCKFEDPAEFEEARNDDSVMKVWCGEHRVIEYESEYACVYCGAIFHSMRQAKETEFCAV